MADESQWSQFMFPASIIEPQTPINRTQNQPSNDDSRRRSRVLSGGKFKVLFVVVHLIHILVFHCLGESSKCFLWLCFLYTYTTERESARREAPFLARTLTLTIVHCFPWRRQNLKAGVYVCARLLCQNPKTIRQSGT